MRVKQNAARENDAIKPFRDFVAMKQTKSLIELHKYNRKRANFNDLNQKLNKKTMRNQV